MNYTPNNRAFSAAQTVMDELLAEGVRLDDIYEAAQFQETQRSAGVPVLSIRQILGLDAPPEPQRTARQSVTSVVAPVMQAATRAFGREQTRLRRKSKGGLHVTGARVWRDSVAEGGEEERAFIQRPTKSYTAMMNKAAARLDGLGRDMARIRRNGTRELTTHEFYVSLFNDADRRVFRFLNDQQAYFKGQCSPSIAAIAKAIHRCERTVYNALKRLQTIGLVEWLRRKVIITPDKHEPGARPSAEQTSNIYRCVLPKWLAKMLRIEPVPLPDDELSRLDSRHEDLAVMIAQASPRERASMMPSEPALRAAIMAAAMRLDNRAGLNPAHLPDCNICDGPPLIHL